MATIPGYLKGMSEANQAEFNRVLHNNKLTILITDLERVKIGMYRIFGYEHADSKLIDDIIRDMEEAKISNQ